MAALRASETVSRARGGRVAMAAYLRSVVGRASERLAPMTDPKRDDNQQEDGGTARDTEGVESVVKLGTIDASPVSGCETASSSSTMEEAAEPPEDQEPQFELHIDEISATEVLDEVFRGQGKVAWSYCDVLLQSDEHGLGLNLKVMAAPQGLELVGVREKTAVVVSSFRRLHSQDVGPAEASAKIRTGDILWSIEGERVATIEAVAARLSRRAQEASDFLLLRFVRPADSNNDCNILSPAHPVNMRPASTQNAQLPVDVAMLIRQLVARNQNLEEQLLASRLKQDEQRIQLDQLHALYAKTQLENWSAFSLPKPFVRRGMSTADKSGVAAPGAARATSLSSAAARLMGANAMQYDVEFAVNAERERLTRQFEQQFDTMKTELCASYDAQLEALRLTADKKIRMLEFGVKELLALSAPRTGGKDAVPREVSPHILALRHQLLHHREDKEGGDESTQRCLLCMLAREHEVVAKETCSSLEDTWRNQIIDILGEYAVVKTNRELALSKDVKDSESCKTRSDSSAMDKTEDGGKES